MESPVILAETDGGRDDSLDFSTSSFGPSNTDSGEGDISPFVLSALVLSTTDGGRDASLDFSTDSAASLALSAGDSGRSSAGDPISDFGASSIGLDAVFSMSTLESSAGWTEATVGELVGVDVWGSHHEPHLQGSTTLGDYPLVQ